MTDIQWTSTTAKLGSLKPWQGNPKTSTGKQHAQLTNSFDELGQFQTVAISPTGDVYDGHQRLSALLAKHGKDYEVQALQSSRPLTDEERRKIAIYSRQIGAWDWDTLSSWDAGELMEWGFDEDLLKDWGQDYSALSAMLESEAEEPEQGDAEQNELDSFIGKRHQRWANRKGIGFFSVRSFTAKNKDNELAMLKQEKSNMVYIDLIASEISSALISTFINISDFYITSAPEHKTGYAVELSKRVALITGANYERLFNSSIIDADAKRTIFGDGPDITLVNKIPDRLIFIDDTLTTGRTLEACRGLLLNCLFIPVIWIYDRVAE